MKPAISSSTALTAAWAISPVFIVPCIVLSDIQSNIHADSVLPVLVSLVCWSPHYWGADRFGMLLPLLTSPINNPLLNLLLQNLASALTGLSAPFLLAWYLFGRSWAVCIGGLVALAFIGGYPPFLLYEYIGLGQCYGLAAGLAYAGLCLFPTLPNMPARSLTRYLSSALCLLAGFWVTPTLAFHLLPLIALKRLLGLSAPVSAANDTSAALPLTLKSIPRDADMRRIALVLGCFAASYVITRVSPYHGGYALLPLTQALDNGAAVLRHFFHDKIGPPGLVWTVACLSIIGAGFWLFPWDRRRAAWLAKFTLVIGAAVAGELLMVSSSAWVQLNDSDGRYLLLSRTLLLIWPATLLTAGILRQAPGWRQALQGALLTALIATTLLRYGLPSVDKARAGLEQATGRYGQALLTQGCTHVAGDYWTVWPAVFNARWRAWERNQPGQVWGVSERAHNTSQLWSAMPFDRMRICGVRDDASYADYVRGMGVVKARQIEAAPFIVRTPSLPLLYGAQILETSILDAFPDIPGPDTLRRHFRLRNLDMHTYELRDGVVYAYSTTALQEDGKLYVDVDNSGVFIAQDGALRIEFFAYGLSLPETQK